MTAGSALQQVLRHPECAEGIVWTRRRVASQEVVFRQGEDAREVYIVLSGLVQVVGDVELNQARKIQSGFFELGSGAIFGELALFDRKPRSASVMAVSDSELAVIDGDALLAFFDRHPEIGYSVLREMMTVMIERLRKTNKKLFSLFAWGLKAHDIDQHLGS